MEGLSVGLVAVAPLWLVRRLAPDRWSNLRWLSNNDTRLWRRLLRGQRAYPVAPPRPNCSGKDDDADENQKR
jgi:hypothetical protein